MTNFIEIVNDDHCYVCGDDKRHKELLNFNDDTLGYCRICHTCLGTLLAEHTINGEKK